MKIKLYSTLIFLASFAMEVKAQLVLPDFEVPIKLDSLSDHAEESMPVPFLNGNSIYFVRTYIDGNLKQRSSGQEVWTSDKIDGVWQKPSDDLKDINDWGNNAIVGVSENGDRAYVFNSIQSRKRLARGLAFIEKDKEGIWSDHYKVEVEGLTVGEGYYSFYVNPTEDVLMISMAPNDTTLDEDLFVSLKQEDGNWGKVIHLGDVINTKNYEVSPFIAEDKKSLYFSSNGHGGFGASDIFVSYRLDDSWTNWTEPQNLGSTINSVGFDAYFIITNQKEVFFTSNRDQQFSDILYTTITQQLSYNFENLNDEDASDDVPKMEKLVVGEFTLKGIPVENVELEIVDELGFVVDEVTTDSDGQFSYIKLDPEKVYVVRIAEDDKSVFGGGQVYFVDTEGKKTGKFVKTDQGDFAESGESTTKEKVQGVYNYKKLPVARASLIILDESGYPMETIYTDESGKFDYDVLDSSESYSVIPLETDDIDIEDIDLYLADDQGERIKTIPITVAVLALRPLKALPNNLATAEPVDLVYSQFTLKGLPVENVKLEIFDSEGVKVDEVVTDAYGNFSYEKLDPEAVYVIKIAEEDIGDFSGGKVYFVDKEGEKTGRYVGDGENGYATEGIILNPGLIQGIYTYNQLPAERVALGVVDDNGFILDTIYTDANGMFEYESLSADEDYSIVLMETEGIVEENLDIYLIDDQGEKVESQELKQGLMIRKPIVSLLEKNVVYSQLTLKGLPADNIKLEIFDEEGSLVDEVVTDIYGLFSYEKLDPDKVYMVKIAEVDIGDFSGSKVYFVDQEGNKTGRYDKDKENSFIEESKQENKEVIIGMYAYKEKPEGKVKLGVFDESGYLIDSAYTEKDGSFKFEGIDSNESFSVVVMNSDSINREDLDLYLTDKEGAKIEAQPIQEGLMVRKPLISIVDKILVYGQFTYQGLPVENVRLEVYDHEGTLVDEVITDVYGNFKYSKLNPDKIYVIKLLVKDIDVFGNSKVYFVDAQGNKTGRFVETEEGTFVEKAPIEDQEKIQGVFTYESKPVKRAGIIIVDENGIPIDTFYTDSYGKFEFFMMDNDEDYSLIPMNVENVKLENIDLYLTNNEGERVRTLIVEKGKGVYLKNGTDGQFEQASKEDINQSDVYYIYFKFNQYTLSGNDKGILDLVIDVLISYTEATVNLIGHTDNIGSEAVNMRFGEVRAISARQYLKENGIIADRISIESKGETKPIASNGDSKGRAKNRRVEVFLNETN